jgi:hypothetical protein
LLKGVNHVQEPTPVTTQTGHQVRSPAKEASEAESADQAADQQEEVMQHPGWLLIIVGLLIAGIGLVWLIAPSIPWLGKLPGDISVERESFRFYFPIVTCIVVSVVLTGNMWLVRYMSR